MRIALFSDLHARARNLDSALHQAEKESADQIWALGDLVGYGREPGYVVELARERFSLNVLGNHEIFLDLDETFPPYLAHSLELARDELQEAGRDWLRSLPLAEKRENLFCTHASALGPLSGFLDHKNPDLLLQHLDLVRGVSFVGHTHRPLILERRDRGRIFWQEPGAETYRIQGEVVLNPGSLGTKQSSGADRRPSWMMLDLEQMTCSWHRLDPDLIADSRRS